MLTRTIEVCKQLFSFISLWNFGSYLFTILSGADTLQATRNYSKRTAELKMRLLPSDMPRPPLHSTKSTLRTQSDKGLNHLFD